MPKKASGLEKVKLWRLSLPGDVDLMRATYITQRFPRHAHDGFAIGVVEEGALGFYYRGENVVAPAGSVNLANAGETHTGHAATEAGWTYRMFYFGEDALRKAATEMADRPSGVPYFPAGVILDDDLARVVRSLHVSLESGHASELENESRFLGMLALLTARYADAPPVLRGAGRERRSVKRARDFIEAHYDENISLDRLAAVADLSRFHFLRVFAMEVGAPPHAYLTQVRIRKARELLAGKRSVSAVAMETGFVDQSHFTRHFKRITGVTPARYSKIVQDG